MIEKLKSTYGFSKTPFGRGLAPQMLHRHGAHAEAVARIDWCISERGLGVVTGEVGAGKTVAVRAALADLDTSRHTVIYLGNVAELARIEVTGSAIEVGAADDGSPRTIVSCVIGPPPFGRCFAGSRASG